MKFALVVAHVPTDPSQKRQGNWPSFLGHANGQPPQIGDPSHPSENVWLLTLPDETPVLARIVHYATERQIQYRVLYFDHLPLEFSAQGAP